MRNQQAPLIRVNVFYPEIEPLCSDSGARSTYLRDPAAEPKTDKMCITNKGGDSGDHCNVPAKNSKGPCKKERCKDKLLLPQPLFMLEKKERPLKRHASDLVLTSESGHIIYSEKRVRSSSFTFRPSCSPPCKGNGVSEKRVRSSSFTFLSAFPPSQSVLKNNIFMPSSLVEENPSTTNQATLQPPQGSLCWDRKGECGTEVTEKCSISLDNANKTQSGIGPNSILDIKERRQPCEELCTSEKKGFSFVFGENMDQRALRPHKPAQPQTPKFQCKRDEPSSQLQSSPRSLPFQRPWENASRTLLDSAAAVYTSSPRPKYELDQVEIITGEESERNVLQVNCKLFVLNKATQMWTERGRGYLRLNDSARNDGGVFRSRIVVRNLGNLKLIFNSKIFDQMTLERANRKSIRITATDLMDNSLKVFLIQASVKDAGRLYAAIHYRLVALRTCGDQEQKAPSIYAETDSNFHPLKSESEDEDESATCHRNISDHHQWIRRQPVLYSS
ncbi:ran-binding protein 3-like [Pelodytes ibericus]